MPIPKPVTVNDYHPISAPFTVQDLQDAAEVVAILRPSGTSEVHWNSADGQAWTHALGDARLPYIYHDDVMEVVNVLRGSLDGPTVVVRGVGGTVDNTTINYEGMPAWKAGAAHMVYLRRAETPTKEGSEIAWVVVADSQGVFTVAGNGTMAQRRHRH